MPLSGSTILLVAEVSAGCRVVVLLFRRHLRDNWLRGFSAAERVAVVRPTGRSDGHLAVWIVYYVFIRNLEQNVCGPDEYQPKLIHETLMNDELAANALCASLCQGASPGNNFTRSSEPPSWMA